jgi:hypothetical protein
MDDNAGLWQAGLIDPLIDGVSVIAFFKGTLFIAPIRTGFDPSLWVSRYQTQSGLALSRNQVKPIR